MKVKLLLVAALTFGCGAMEKPQFVQDVQSLFEQARIDLVNGGNWLFDRIQSGVNHTTKELDSCFSGGCDLREAMRGPEGTKGNTGSTGQTGSDGRDGIDGVRGADGANGIDGAGCAVLQADNGAVVTCGDSTAVIYNGKDGLDGVDGQDGTNGTNGTDGAAGRDGTNGTNGRNGAPGEDGEGCSLVRSNFECRGDNLKYDLHVVCGEDSARLGKFTDVGGCAE